jgi:predicted alpha-1,6-mannanase (GH76 family)
MGACVYASGQVYVYAYGICICICKRLSVCNIMQRDKTIIIINVWHTYFWQAHYIYCIIRYDKSARQEPFSKQAQSSESSLPVRRCFCHHSIPIKEKAIRATPSPIL